MDINNKKVIILVKKGVKDRLAKFCEQYRTKDGFKIRMGEFSDIAITEKLDRMEEEK